MKIIPISKPDKKATKDNKPYWSFKAKDENGKEKSGNFFGETEPVIDVEIEVEEKEPTGNYTNFTWFTKKTNSGKQGFPSKPSMSIDSQIRIVALQEANKTYDSMPEKKGKITDIAKAYEKYIKTGE